MAVPVSDAQGARNPELAVELQWLQQGGELGRLISAFPWQRTPLGPLTDWPQSLRTAVSLMLSSQHPMWIGWGPAATFLYNDAYISVLSRAKHPWALGRPAAEVWAEIWDVCGPLADKVFRHGEASFVNDVQLFMNRGEFVEETYYSFSYSPIRDESGRVGGLFCPSADVSGKVLNARRLATLSELAANSLVERTVAGACTSGARTLAKNTADIPFALVYLADAAATTVTRIAAAGLAADDAALAPPTCEFAPNRTVPWPFADVIERGALVTAPVPRSVGVAPGLAGQPVTQAVVLPIRLRGRERAVGVLVAGISPARRLDHDYRTFFDLVAGQLATAVQNAGLAEDQRRRADELAELDRAKTIFFSNVSHELRTPLTLMLGPLEEIATAAGTDGMAATRDLARVAHRNGLRLLRLVNTLLDFSRMEAGRMQATFAATDLASFTAELASTFRAAIVKAGISFGVQCPPLDEPVYVDRDLWEKIVFNLLSNAFKFTLRGRIDIAIGGHPDHVRLTVSDTGVGIPAHAQSRIFERFYRVEGNVGRTQEGTGIGLALVHELVKLHGGTLQVHSREGVGTTFTVDIPRGRQHLPAERVHTAPPLDAAAAGGRAFIEEASRWEHPGGGDLGRIGAAAEGRERRGRVLLVDDNADMRDYVAHLLAGRVDLTSAADGQAALELAHRDPPDLILSDVMMPRLDGFGLVRAIRAAPKLRRIPIILLSARAGEEARVEGLDEGADDYLVKPFGARELIARVSTHLQLARLRNEAEATAREAEERLRLAIAAAAIGTWSWEIAANRLEWSERTCEIFGRPAAPATFDDYLALVHRDDRPRVAQAVREAVESGRAFHADFRVVAADGRMQWISGDGKVIPGPDGRPARMLGTVIDVTDQREREQALHDTRARLNATLDAAAVGTWTWDMDRNRLLGDAAVFRLFSCPHPDAEMAPLDELLPRIHPEDLPRVQRALAEARDGRHESFEEDYRVLQPDGTCRWVASRGRVRRAPGPEAPVMYGVLVDVTQRKAAEQERAVLLQHEREAREEAQALMETARALSANLDLHATVQAATDAATRLTGAKFGAFFYNLVNERGESYVLYTLSGAPKSAFEKFGLPRNTPIFGPTFRGEGAVRLADVTADPRYGHNAPHHGMPKGHPPVKSYLAVPVISRTGEVLGGLFFGHPEAGVFTERSERIVTAIAAQAAIAIDNAKLYHRIQSTVDRLNFSLAALELGDWTWEVATDDVQCSPRMLDIFGLPPEARFTRERIRAAVHPDDREAARRAAQASIDTKSAYAIEYRIIHPGRGQRWVAVKGRPVFDDQNRMTGLIGVAQDVTERKRAEVYLRRQKEVLEQIVTDVPLRQILDSLALWVEASANRTLVASVLVLDPDGRQLHPAGGPNCPPAWSAYIDQRQIGLEVGWCGPPALRHERVIIRDIETDPRWAAHRDEALRHGLRASWSSPILGSSGALLGTFAIYHPEVTEPTAHEMEVVDVIARAASIAIERKRADEALRESRAQLEAYAQTLERLVAERTVKLRETIGELEAFSYSVSHDMRAPLRSMYGYAELMLKDFGAGLDPVATQYLKRISKNAARLDLLVRDVLAYSKVAKEDVELTAMDLDVFVSSFLGQLPDAQRPGVTLRIESPLGLVYAHEAYLSQIFSNLVGNAVKFARPGVPPEIVIRSAPEAGWVKVSVSDNGIGIKPEHFPRIFEIFGRVYPDKEFEGTGIGLSIVKKAVQRMGGAVGVDSALGRGSTFWFTLRSHDLPHDPARRGQ